MPKVTARPPSVSPSARACERRKAAASMTTTGVRVSAISGEMREEVAGLHWCAASVGERLMPRTPAGAARPRGGSAGCGWASVLVAVIRLQPGHRLPRRGDQRLRLEAEQHERDDHGAEHADLAASRGRRTTSRGSPRPGRRAASSTGRRRWRTRGRRRRARRPSWLTCQTPTRMRNSATKLPRPGRPSEAMAKNMAVPPIRGATVPEAAHLVHVAGVDAVLQAADHDEEGARARGRDRRAAGSRPAARSVFQAKTPSSTKPMWLTLV